MKNKGFTLIEIMIVVAIVSVLAALAFPNFSQYLQKSRRTDGIVALNGLQQAQAKLRANCRWFAEDLGTANDCAAAAADSVVKYPSTTENDYYTISILAGSASGNSYTAIATGKGVQANDADCFKLVLRVNTADINALQDPNGLKRSINKTGTESADDSCWH